MNDDDSSKLDFLIFLVSANILLQGLYLLASGLIGLL